MDLYKKMKVSKSRYILVFAAVFLCLLMVGNASATDGTTFPVGAIDVEPDGEAGRQTKEKIGRATSGTTFPVDDAGIAAYVKVSESIELEGVLDIYPYGHVEVLNETYVIGTVQNADGFWTHLYIGADGWVIPYYLNTEHASCIVRWNKSSTYDPTPENVTAMNTLEEIISKVCPYLGVDYETIKPEIKYYNFKYPNATIMKVIVDIAQGVSSDSFKLWIPSEFIESVNECSWSHYTNHKSDLYRDGSYINFVGWPDPSLEYGYTGFGFDYLHQIEIKQSFGSEYTSGVGLVLVYTKRP
jgi:hypothetical protein